MPRFFALADALLVTLKPEPIFALTIPSKVQAYLACGRPIVAALDGEGARVVREAGPIEGARRRRRGPGRQRTGPVPDVGIPKGGPGGGGPGLF